MFALFFGQEAPKVILLAQINLLSNSILEVLVRRDPGLGKRVKHGLNKTKRPSDGNARKVFFVGNCCCLTQKAMRKSNKKQKIYVQSVDLSRKDDFISHRCAGFVCAGFAALVSFFSPGKKQNKNTIDHQL